MSATISDFRFRVSTDQGDVSAYIYKANDCPRCYEILFTSGEPFYHELLFEGPVSKLDLGEAKLQAKEECIRREELLNEKFLEHLT